MSYSFPLKYFLYFISFFILELLYFKIASKFKIVDNPNHRSSHASVILRGGGIIFPISALFFLLSDSSFLYLSISLFLLTLVSFWDDVVSLSSYLRVFVHIVAVILMLIQSDLSIPIYFYVLIGFFVIGIINFYNFMDGINGITSFYSLVIIGFLYYININYIHFINNELLVFLILSLIVFSYFNVRKIAKCFSGDVGSITISFIFCYLIILLIADTGFYLWILFFAVYGIDTGFTLLCRILRKESITQAHRSHFYQFLVNELKWDHLKVSFLYAILQFIMNVVVLLSYYYLVYWYSFALLVAFGLLYIIFRFKFEGKTRLFVKY